MTREEFLIPKSPSEQQALAIYEDIVVWEDSRGGDSNIYVADLVKQQEFEIKAEPGIHVFPAIYKDIVVWTDMRVGDLRNSSWEICGYNRATGQEFQITHTEGDTFADEEFEGEYLVLEDYFLNRNTLTVCFRNMLSTESMVINEYRNDSLVNSHGIVLTGNSVTCFELDGTYTVGDNVTLETQKGTILTFDIVFAEEPFYTASLDVKYLYVGLIIISIIIVVAMLKKKL